jgi:hypothetical protein
MSNSDRELEFDRVIKAACEAYCRSDEHFEEGLVATRANMLTHLKQFPSTPEEFNARSYIGFVGVFQRADLTCEVVHFGRLNHDKALGLMMLRGIENVGSLFGKEVSIDRQLLGDLVSNMRLSK